MELIEISSTRRRVTYDITPEDAQQMIDWLSTKAQGMNDPTLPQPVRELFNPMFAIANKREYGGH